MPDHITHQTAGPADDEPYITLGEAAKLAPGRPSTNAIWRWCRKGVRSRSGRIVRLEHVRAGKRLFTTEGWVHQFLAQLAGNDLDGFDSAGPPAAPDRPGGAGEVTGEDRRPGRGRTEAILKRAGIRP